MPYNACLIHNLRLVGRHCRQIPKMPDNWCVVPVGISPELYISEGLHSGAYGLYLKFGQPPGPGYREHDVVYKWLDGRIQISLDKTQRVFQTGERCKQATRLVNHHVAWLMKQTITLAAVSLISRIHSYIERHWRLNKQCDLVRILDRQT